MKSRTSFFNPAVFKKDLTRFAPAWVLYTVGLFMVLAVVLIDDFDYSRSSNLANSVSFMAALNLGYGFLNGQLLFGDLFSARHCNALHAMPLRRECWFVTHTVSGLLFAFGPNALMALVCMTMLGGGWTVALWWLLAVCLQYLFFFGLAVFSALCVGNRFAMLLVYGIVNFFSLIVFWFYHTMYEPLLYGVYSSEQPFLLFCPVWKMIDNYEMIDVVRGENIGSIFAKYLVKSVTLGEGWGYLAICAAIGAVLLGAALLLYRRRKLESAGDFMAVRALEPVFLVLYTMCAAAGFQVFAELFGAPEYLFLALGLIVGFFTGRMLLMRTIRVFQPKGFLWFGVLAVVFLLSLLLTWLDPIGLTRYIPELDQIREAKISTSYNPDYGNEPYHSDPADIETIRQIHQLVLDGEIYETTQEYSDYYNNLCIQYVLDGRVINRKYEVACSSAAGQLAETLYTRPEYILGTDDAKAFIRDMNRVYFDSYKAGGDVSGEIYGNGINTHYIRGLVNAILADCAEGTMAQSTGYHADEEQYAWVEFSKLTEGGYYQYYHVVIYPCNRNTVAYLEANPFPVQEEYG